MKLTHSYQTLPNTFYQKVAANSSSQPKLVLFNTTLADSLNINSDTDINTLTGWFAGNQLPTTARPIAQAYAGHQFGQLNMLGDGRALLLGELETKAGLIDIQLKGSGVTPYSRNGDGKATLSAMLREYLISEAMYALNIPTTRSLAIVNTGEQIYRSGQTAGAVLTRTASSHIRVGTFVYASILDIQAKTGNHENLLALLNYTVNRHYPKFNDLPASQKALALLEQVMFRQAQLVASWQRVGFIHGVMNTDNITISGETIDYGPCAFMDTYDEKAVFSSIDYQGRYAYKNQMPIMWWNMARFAESLVTIIDDDANKAIATATKVLNNFGEFFNTEWTNVLCHKAGLVANEDNKAFVNKLLAILQDNEYDYTNSFRDLTLLMMYLATNLSQEITTIKGLDVSVVKNINDTFINNHDLFDWLTNWYKRVVSQQKQGYRSLDNTVKQMQSHNPLIIPRNHLVESALTQATLGDLTEFDDLLAVLQKPYDWHNYPQITAYQQPATKDWTNHYKTFCGT